MTTTMHEAGEAPLEDITPLTAALTLEGIAEDLKDLQLADDDGTHVTPGALGFTVASGALAAGGAAWMIGGMFRGMEPRLVALLGVVLGAGLVWAGTRWRSTILQFLVLPASLLLGAVLMGSAAGAGTSSLPSLVKDAVTSSQVLQPPIDPAPGWRLILVVLLALISAAACTLGLSLAKPRLAVALPVPLILVAALVQPDESAIVTGAISVGFLLMGLSTSFAADGVGDTFDRGFEVRRILRSVVGGAVLIGLLIAASQVSFLFPEQDTSRVIPPRRPPITPPAEDVPLYTVDGVLEGPLRLGVIDVYDPLELAWMLPPVDNRRLVRAELPSDVPDARTDVTEPTSLTITVDQATGRLLPTPAGAVRVDGDVTVDHDPRTQGLSLVGRSVFTGLSYEVLSAPAPDGTQLSAADTTVPEEMQEFLTAPAPPQYVQELLLEAPEQPYARLQSLRAVLLENVIAAGQGQPTDVGPDRVVELMNGATGNPYELTAAEALLARWAGVPSRLGFGYYDASLAEGGTAEFRPADAATYLEVWFREYGWVPIVGTPPQAQQSLDNNQRDADPNIRSSPELGISVFLPVIAPNGLPIYAYFRYYLVRIIPPVLVFGAGVVLYPLWLKRRRRRLRTAWALEHGPAGAVAVAYAALRDQMIDLALPGRGTTPLELVELVEEDEEHAELAWLVTRGLWGDMRDQLTTEDAAVAEQLASSVGARLTKAQPETARLLAAVSRASLAAPWSTSLPNVWWTARLRDRLPRPQLGRRLKAVGTRLRRRRGGVVTTTMMLLVALVLGGCAEAGVTADLANEPDVAFPTRLAPTGTIGGLVVREEVDAENAYIEGATDPEVIVAEGTVISFSKSGLVQAALQVAQLKPGYVTSDRTVARAIANSLGSVTELDPQRDHELFSLEDGSQRVYLWFPTEKAMALLVTRTAVPDGAAEALARALIDYGDGLEIEDEALTAAFSTLPIQTVAEQPTDEGTVEAPEVAPAASERPTDGPTGAATPEPDR